MRIFNLWFTSAFVALLANYALATTHYVDLNSSNPVSPYTDWSAAATNIQDAIDVSTNGDQVLVTNGVYQTGGRCMDRIITNRVAVYKPIRVQSVNGPDVTIIQGALDPSSANGPGAIRCAWLTNNAVLSGFTLQGGATRAVTSSADRSMDGGGVWGNSTSATVDNCVIVTNFASHFGGGAYSVTLNHCTLSGNHAVGSGTPDSGFYQAGSGGGAANCNLTNCFITANSADQSDAGGALNCHSVNCAFTKNRASTHGSAAYQGTLLNCTVANNTFQDPFVQLPGYGGAVASATLTNCIVYGNIRTKYGSTNYVSCTFSYSDTDPLPTGAGNIDIDPLLLADGIHLASTSPCIEAGAVGVVFGADIDGQTWGNPPPIGCDEWQPTPVAGSKPSCYVTSPAHGLVINITAAGQAPFTCFWSKDGTPIQDDVHYTNSATANLVVNNWGPADAGAYQVVVSNTFGVVTSQVAQVVIHAVDCAGVNPVAPYTTWATAATNIQDAIDAASTGDIVLVTNGIYATGGKVMDAGLTNRVTLDKPMTVISVNGYAATVIEGARDPASVNGPGAVRCAYLVDGAVLMGFTLRNGATGAGIYDPSHTGGGVRCVSTNGIVSNCVLTNNSAYYGGGGISYGTLNNSLVANNQAPYGAGAYNATLNNCTVIKNYNGTPMPNQGAGTYGGVTRNSVVVNNYCTFPYECNYSITGFPDWANYCYSWTRPLTSTGSIPTGAGNINGGNTPFLDEFHINSAASCCGAGNALYASGTDLDGEPWANPPSMGCDEVVLSNLVGPLSVSIGVARTNVIVNRSTTFAEIITGHASRIEWSFGDGPTITDAGTPVYHQWTTPGDYALTLTAFNTDNPAGVSTNVTIHVQIPDAPQLQSAAVLTNGFHFQFIGQFDAWYALQYATNLTPPVIWNTFAILYSSSDGIQQITDPAPTNEARFYRVRAY